MSFEAAGDDPTPNCARATTLRLAEEEVGDDEQPLQSARALLHVVARRRDELEVVGDCRGPVVAVFAWERGTSASAHAGEREHSATASASMAAHPFSSVGAGGGIVVSKNITNRKLSRLVRYDPKKWRLAFCKEGRRQT